MRRAVLALVALAATAAPATADWPQWRGPGRDGLDPDLHSRSDWPAEPTRAWSVEVGEGHASPLLVGGVVYVFGRQGDEEVVRALRAETGEEVWRSSYPAPYTMNPAARRHGPGPKSTPVWAEGRLVALGIGGILSCFDAETGRVLWRKDFTSEYPATSPTFGTAMSPLVDDGHVIAHVGGGSGGALTAFDLATGDVAWRWTGDTPAYASPVVAEMGGVRQVITFSHSSLFAVAADSGELLWQIPFTTPYDQNAVTPVVAGDVVIYSGLDHPIRAVRPRKTASGWTTEEVWENDEVGNYMSTPVLADGRLYGFSNRRRGQLFSLDAKTGATEWLSEGRQGDNAAVIAGGGTLYVLTTDSELIVAPLGGDAFAPRRTWTVADTPTWAHPVITDGGVLVKDKEALTMWRFEGGPKATAAVVPPPEKGVEMSWIYFVLGAVLSWGLYGPVLHRGQVALGSPLKAFLFVGFAYFLVGVLIPLATLVSQGELSGFSSRGAVVATVAGVLGALGAICVIYSFRAGGNPLWVMPLVFSGAPIVNVLYSMWEHPPKTAPSPMLYVGFLLAAAGAYMVLHYKPQG